MCGIFGIWKFDGKPLDISAVCQTTSTLQHRGPDDEGYLLVNTQTNRFVPCGGPDTSSVLGLSTPDLHCHEIFDFAFGFRRLAILDPSPAGHQPMVSANGHFWIVFNGEIYNYLELQAELKTLGYCFKSGTDTEVILAAYEAWGEDCLGRFNGMWAFALWDGRRQQLFCARDRFGIKPFYYFWDKTTFAFASEIKALLSLPDLPRQPNDGIIYDYLSAGLLDHTTETFFKGINQLAPAHYLVLRHDQLVIHRYWDLDPLRPVSSLTNEAAYVEQFYALFEEAIRLHLRSDVAIGTCLSGGLDSSSIVCVANKLLFTDQVLNPELVGQQQKTFSSCFEDERFDERKYINQILAITGAEPNFTFPQTTQFFEDLSRLIWHQDEPFGSTSIYAQWCVMKRVAERGVKVLLDGQGGDELLAGYHTYFGCYWATLARQGQWPLLWHELSAYRAIYPSSLTRLMARILRYYAPPLLLRVARRFEQGRSLGLNNDFAEHFQDRISEKYTHYGEDIFHNVLYSTFTRTNLPALLHYEDRNSMAHSVEARVPFLDYRLVEYVFSLPADQKIKNGLTKNILRNALKGTLPELIRMRTDKMGFVTPERIWLNTELKAWIQDIIYSKSFGERGYFDVSQISAALKAHMAGKRDLTFLAWRWINLELWLRHMIDTRPTPF